MLSVLSKCGIKWQEKKRSAGEENGGGGVNHLRKEKGGKKPHILVTVHFVNLPKGMEKVHFDRKGKIGTVLQIFDNISGYIIKNNLNKKLK